MNEYRFGQSTTLDEDDPYLFTTGIEDYDDEDDYDYYDEWNEDNDMPPLAVIYHVDVPDPVAPFADDEEADDDI